MMFTASSIGKLTPIRMNIIYCATFPPPAHVSIRGIKKIIQPKRKIPVFTIGHTIAENITARYLPFLIFSFSVSLETPLYVNAAIYPQATPLRRTVANVPPMLKAINGAESIKSTTIAQIKPSRAPIEGPISAAPITIGTNDRLSEKRPNLASIDAVNCNTTTNAARIAPSVV